ncbi:carboxypeptidase N subunit 2 isoform X1 [Anabrus simplex]|uniref:carboxypeptidase N subunit 2 isoform X1 n=3 Tax=Anabrus simplex TaxID=316456 RepID=UPI0035A3A77C
MSKHIMASDMITFLILVGIARVSGMCPFPCKCEISYSSVRHVTDCSNASLGKIPVFDVRTHELLACCNSISEVTEGTFSRQEMPEVEMIDLSSNRISMIERPSLAMFPNLQVLLLAKNRITWLPRDVFRDTPSLRSLDFSHNPLLSAPRLDIPLLQWLSISHCGLSKLPLDSFKLSPRLENIKLNHNEIQSIPAELFSGLKLLKYLHLEGNQLEVLHPDTFKANRNFYWLNISENMIKLPENDSFLNADELNLLDLGQCNLRFLPAESLSNLPKLTQLRLHGNNFLSLSNESFANLQALEYLELQDNQLLNLDFLSHLQNLTYLDVAYNELTTLDVDVFQNMTYLHTLYVSGNPLLCDCVTSDAINWCISRNIRTAYDDLDCLELLDCGREPQNFTDALMTSTTGRISDFQVASNPASSSTSEQKSCDVPLYLIVLLVIALCTIVSLTVALIVIQRRLRRQSPKNILFKIISPSRSVDSETFLHSLDSEVI